MTPPAADIPGLDWISLRQICAVALAYEKPVRISGAGSYLSQHPKYLPIFEDIIALTAAAGLGKFDTEAGDILFQPGSFDSYRLEVKSGKFSSFVELVLYLAPWCFRRDFRTVLDCHGVSHSQLSLPTSCIRESLNDYLENMGLYGSMQLQRFGFYGSGGGSAEARIYPSEAKKISKLEILDNPEITAGRIFIAGISPELAKRQKARVMELLKLPDRSVAIIEIRDADGMGNSLQVALKDGGRTIQVDAEMPIFNHSGEMVVDEGEFNSVVEDVCGEALGVVYEKRLPQRLLVELLPFCFLSGNEALVKDRNEKTNALLEVFSSLRDH